MATTAVPAPIVAGQRTGKGRVASLRPFLPAYLMCAPTVLLFLVFMAFPIVFVLYTLLLNWDGITSIFDARWVGLENYQNLVRYAVW